MHTWREHVNPNQKSPLARIRSGHVLAEPPFIQTSSVTLSTSETYSWIALQSKIKTT